MTLSQHNIIILSLYFIIPIVKIDPVAIASLLETCGFEKELDCKYIRRAIDVVIDGKEDGATKMLSDKVHPERAVKILIDRSLE